MTETNGIQRSGLCWNGFVLKNISDHIISHGWFLLPKTNACSGIWTSRENFEGEELLRYSRTNLGFLSLDGIAQVPVVNTSVTVPIQGYTNATDFTPSNAPDAEFLLHTINVEFYTLPGSAENVTALNSTILDTGTALNVVPQDVAAAYAAAFKPPAVLTTVPNSKILSGFAVDCNAEAPEFLVTIGGKTFSIDSRDQIVPLTKWDNGTVICATGTQGTSALANDPGAVMILGDVFLYNVVTTYNLIAGEVTLTQRAKY
ncbi:aspartic peptidase domain-containing protein [Mycena crocata]|nr:aspartic peptidase domain-containing protein [Mycena crocata]